MAQQPRDVPGIIAAPVMRAFQREPCPLQRFAYIQCSFLHPYLTRPAIGHSRQVLDVKVRRAKGVRDAERGAVALELLPVVVAETREEPFSGLVLVHQHPACLGQRDAAVHVRLR
jgi:hypothetical protein